MCIIRSLFSLLVTRLSQSSVYHTRYPGWCHRGNRYEEEHKWAPRPRWQLLLSLFGLPLGASPTSAAGLLWKAATGGAVVDETDLRLTTWTHPWWLSRTTVPLNLPSHSPAMVISGQESLNPNKTNKRCPVQLTSRPQTRALYIRVKSLV